MKTMKRIHCPAYPNAASLRYYFGKLMDGALTVASAAGAVCALVFLIML